MKEAGRGGDQSFIADDEAPNVSHPTKRPSAPPSTAAETAAVSGHPEGWPAGGPPPGATMGGWAAWPLRGGPGRVGRRDRLDRHISSTPGRTPVGRSWWEASRLREPRARRRSPDWRLALPSSGAWGPCDETGLSHITTVELVIDFTRFPLARERR